LTTAIKEAELPVGNDRAGCASSEHCNFIDNI